MTSIFKRKHWMFSAVFIAILMVVVLLLSPLKIRHDVSSVARIIPAREWLIQRNDDGSLISSVKDYRSGFTENYFAALVARGDAIHFRINPALLQKPGITAGDTVGYIRSNEIERRLAELKGLLKIAQASLVFYRTGAKKEVISEARRSDELSKEKARLQQRLYERQKMLHDKQLVSEEEIEIAHSASKISQLEAELAMARLESAASGAKPEQLMMVWSEIERYEKEIQVLEDRLDQFTIRSTLTGQIYKSFSSDTLLMAGEKNFVLVIPVPWTERHAISEGSKVTLLHDGNHHGSIVRLNLNSGILNGEQVFTVIAELEESVNELAPYLYSNCTIEGTRLTPGEYLIKFIQKMFAR